MARLPTVDTLAQSVPQTTSKTGSYRVREVINPLSGLGEAGEILLKRAAIEKDAADKFAKALAEEHEYAKYLNAVAELDATIDFTQTEIDKNPDDYMNAEKMAVETLNPRAQELAATLNPKYQRRFQAAATPKLSSMIAKQRTYALEQGRSRNIAASNDRIFNYETAHANASDPIEQEIIESSIAEELALQRRMAANPVELQEKAVATDKRLATNQLNNMSLGQLRDLVKNRFKDKGALPEEMTERYRAASISYVLDKWENTPELTVDTKDAEGKPASYVKHGINGKVWAKKLKSLGIELKNLTKEQAIEHFYIPIWNDIGGDNLPTEVRLAVFDTAVNMGAPTAKRLYKLSGGDLNKFTRLRKNKYERIAKNNPALAENLNGWVNRAEDIQAASSQFMEHLKNEEGGVGSYVPQGDLLDVLGPDMRDKVDALIEKKQGEALVAADGFINNAANEIVDNPLSFYETLEIGYEEIASLNLSDEDAAKKVAEMESSFADAYISALTEEDDIEAEGVLRSGELDDFLTPAEKRQALKDIETKRASDRVERERIETEQRYADEDGLFSDILLGEMDEDGNVVRKIPFEEAKRKIAASSLRGSAKSRMLSLLNDREKGTLAETDWSLFANLKDRIDDKDDPITIGEIRQYINAGLKYSDLKTLEDRFNKPVDAAVKRAEDYLYKSIVQEMALGGTDPKNKELAMRAQFEMTDAINEMKEQGKSRAEIYRAINPNRKDNILNDIVSFYRRDFDTVMRDKMNAMENAVKGNKARREGESLEEYDKRIGGR